MSPTQNHLRLKRVKAGEYTTKDGRYRILLDPHSENGTDSYRHGGVTWWVIDTTGELDWSDCEYQSLRSAREALQQHLTNR